MDVRVECYAGYRGEEEPRALFLGGRRIAVVKILDRWLAPDHRYFKVRGEDNAVYVLRDNPDERVWTLTVLDRTGADI